MNSSLAAAVAGVSLTQEVKKRKEEARNGGTAMMIRLSSMIHPIALVVSMLALCFLIIPQQVCGFTLFQIQPIQMKRRTISWKPQTEKMIRSQQSLPIPMTSSDFDFEKQNTASGIETQTDGRPIGGKNSYNLGLGKNRPVFNSTTIIARNQDDAQDQKDATSSVVTTRKLIANDDEQSKILRGALWDEAHYTINNAAADPYAAAANWGRKAPVLYQDIDLSIPESVYAQDGSVDLVWDLLRYEAYQESLREPLLVSFLHSTVLNHPSLESSLAFLLANRLQSPAMMISTQLQSLILEALHQSPDFRIALRADMMAVRDRDPACNALPDVFLYFKGFHALQSYRTANYLWKKGKRVLASYLQSQVSQVFQIDIHPNATLGSGLMLDHGTGIVIGETARVGHNCSILHHVTLGGSGKKGVTRHPQVGNGVLLGAGATVLGAVKIGDGSQVGAGTLVIDNLPAHCVAVGVPARVIGNFIDVNEQPSIEMNQVPDPQEMRPTPEFFGPDGI